MSFFIWLLTMQLLRSKTARS